MLLFLVSVVLLPIMAVVLDGVYEAVTADTKKAAHDHKKRTAVIERINLDRKAVRKAS